MAASKDEEKEMELEALLAIYEGELKIVAEDGQTGVSYRVELVDIDAVLTLTLADEYPVVAPTIRVERDGKNVKDLDGLLLKTARELQGEVMIHNLVEEAKDWARKNKISTETTKINEDSQVPTVCKFFLEGKCKFGDRCFNKHELIETGDKTSSFPVSLHSGISTEARQSKENKMISTDSSNDSNLQDYSKKTRMKTATDVISRILWDENIDKKDFCIGYLDRFVGILERPFSEFCWEDMATVDYNVLSVPRHRIQYFKYRGDIVWDKRERLDKVFGSTGGGETILDVKQITGEVKNVPEQDESSEGDDDMEDVNDGTLDEFSRNGSKRDKIGPNYFIAIKIKDSGILDKVQELQQELTAKEPLLADGLIPAHQLHITLLVLTLRTDDQLTQTKNILKGLQHIIPSVLPPTRYLTLKGVGTFRNRILYVVDTEEDIQLQRLVEILKYKFHKAGISLDGNREDFNPHLSVLRVPASKVSPARCQEVFSSFEIAYKDENFGQQGLESIILYSRFAPRELDGSHQRVFTLENSLLLASSTLPKKVLKCVQKFHDNDKCGTSTKEEIEHLLESKTAVALEKALTKLEDVCSSSSTNGSKERVVLIMRGIPGSGKTFLLENSTEAKQRQCLTICSSKQLFHRTGNCKVDESELNIAEAYCRTRFLEALESSVQIIAIDDCHPLCWQYAYFKKMARAFGVTCRVLEIRECCSDVTSCSNVEGVLDLVQDWEKDPEAVCIEPWFRNPKLQQTKGVTIRDLLS